MKPNTEQVTVKIMGREYAFVCEPDEKASLFECCDLVDSKMSAIRAHGRLSAQDRIAVMAALSLAQELAAPGDLQHPQTFPFNFKNVEKQHESYAGINVRLRYFVRVTVARRMADVVREKDLWVYSYRAPPDSNTSIKMDVGIEDCLHIEFEYSKSKYHLKDVIVGRIYFLLVRLKIKHMELSIIRRETTGAAPNQYNESETLVRFEVWNFRAR